MKNNKDYKRWIEEDWEELDLNNNQITKIEPLNDGLMYLWLRNNQITKIENLNENLKELDLDNNQITKIENLNENLEFLYLRDNPVTKISKESYDLIKKNDIKVYGVDIENLEIE